ncbi:M1 family metallopeptidase [Mucilaginibacter sabulilitoris]|uniref:M1 family metallopeptidase n=1 Tax=Mucilaginibacter sabulilitoris TaxID=1173583 RepID=A0ABZ0TIF0_9SPHI|nr:M1 family metallopeptidase [Mucilaginibacter sabulilitoris]WPU92954.1 M1 family metallopeptidase [Mucilaginibacter sabulilitoris]
MIRKFILSAFACAMLAQVQAQDLYMPRDIQQAYNKGTRSADGKPGKNYWQNYGRYNITITALPPNRNIKGTEQITYINNSPDTIKGLNMKLILNIHKPGAARWANAQPDYLTPGIQIDTFLINGQPKKVNSAMATTNQMVSLPKPLMPHDSVKLDIAWHYQISLESGREGMIDSTTYYLAYFYPRVSVYDDYNGWDRLPFIDAQEFYNDFNDYTLQVKAPKNYIVWATGTLQNPNQVLQPEYAKRLQASMTSDSTIHVATAADLAKKGITAQNDVNTWIWKANDISDMAVGISDHYVWDAASTIVDDATHRRASMQAAFLDNAEDFHHAVQNGRNSLSWLSHNWPGVPYPFPKMTSFQGFADMEYPMMVNDSHNDDVYFSQFVQDHEIAHTYFPFYMGINESRYAFMDEGWATTFERLIGTAEVGAQKADSLYKDFRIDRWINDISTTEDLPVITPSSELKGGYGNNSYGKPSLSYFALKDMLGDALFKKALHGYMDRWHGKHPIPWDYFNSMSNITGRNLNWFFNNWFFTNYYIDLDIKNVSKVNGGYTVVIKNIGGFAIPFDVKVTYADGTSETIHQTPAVWEKNQKQITVSLKTDKTIKSVVLDGGIFMDAHVNNNKFVVK